MKNDHLWYVAGGLVVVVLLYYATKPVTTYTFLDPDVITGGNAAASKLPTVSVGTD